MRFCTQKEHIHLICRHVSYTQNLAKTSRQPLIFPSPSDGTIAATCISGHFKVFFSSLVKSATSYITAQNITVHVAAQVELAQYAHLCTIMSNMHHRRAGDPFGTIVDFASDGAGCPLFCLSPLAIHTRNIMEDPRCSLVVQMPGWTGMANARVTIFGDVYQLPPEMHEAAREVLPSLQAVTAVGSPR